MRAIVTVTGKDKVGIIAGVSGLLAELNVNIEDISQTIIGDYFTMFMLVNAGAESGVKYISERLDKLGDELGVKIIMQHEDVYGAMHKI